MRSYIATNIPDTNTFIVTRASPVWQGGRDLFKVLDVYMVAEQTKSARKIALGILHWVTKDLNGKPDKTPVQIAWDAKVQETTLGELRDQIGDLV